MAINYKNKTIFMIDDELGILENYKEITKEYFDVNIETFSSPLDALEKLNAGARPNLFLLDFKMPKMNGLDVILSINKLGIKKPIVVITGFAEKKLAIECLKFGIFDLLEKPVNFDLFINAIKNALCMEETENRNKILSQEKDYLIELFSDYIIKCQERIIQAENLLLDKTTILQEDQNLLNNFIKKIYECDLIDREISKSYKNISKISLIKPINVLKSNSDSIDIETKGVKK
ncbi:response regulator [Spirobacillus cienkowskii]|uniref:response regulator n=1 Tax=Spirobacillus cienkowskii TaxID=495820 RepID=UPI0030D18060